MKIVRIHNPTGLRATKRRRTKVATKRRRTRRAKATTKRRRRNPSTVVARAANPRRRRRRRNPVTSVVARSASRVANPSRRRRRSRKRNPSRRFNPTAMKIGEIFKDMVYGAGGAVATRAISAAVQGFVPAGLASNPISRPILQALVAAFPVRMAAKKFLGQKASDIAMLGGLISAGLEAADVYFPGVQGSLTNILNFAPTPVAPAAQLGGFRGGIGDVYDVPNSVFQGLGDVEDVTPDAFSAIF